MKTKLIIILIFINITLSSNIFGREIIKSCWPSNMPKYITFPKDGSKPYGFNVELILFITNKLNLQLEIVEVDGFQKCLDKIRTGDIDIIPRLSNKGDRSEYMYMIPDSANAHYGFSKKSKYADRIEEIKNNIPTGTQLIKFSQTKYTSSDQHDWSGSSAQEDVIVKKNQDDVIVKKINTILKSDNPNYKESLKLSGTIKDDKTKKKYTNNVYAKWSEDLIKKGKYFESIKILSRLKDRTTRNKYTNNVYEEWSEDLIKKGTGNDNKMFNKIWKSPSPCDKSTGSFSLYDSEKKVDGTLGFPIYQISIDQPNTISNLSISGGFEKLDETHVKNAYGGMIYEQIFEGKKMIHKHLSNYKEFEVWFYECTKDVLDVNKIIEKIRELKWNNKTSLENIKY